MSAGVTTPLEYSIALLSDDLTSACATLHCKHYTVVK